MDVLSSILSCLGLRPVEGQNLFLSNDNSHLFHEKRSPSYFDDSEISSHAAAFIHALLSTPDLAHTSQLTLRSNFFAFPYVPHIFDDHIDSVITKASWYEPLAIATLEVLESALRTGDEISSTIKDAIIKSTAAATALGIIEDHPVFFTLLAIGVLAIVAPWVLELLGFAAEGIVEGSWAAMWQSRYLGFVPKGSLFSFLQRCGMVWG